MEIIPIVISVIALIVSMASFQWNKAKHNLNQLQANANKFCDNLQEFNALCTEYCLTVYKYEIENLYYIKDIEKRNIAFNNLQIEFSKRKDVCKQKHKELLESLDFFEIQGRFYNNELVKILNTKINNYFFKINQFYVDLYDINLIVNFAQKDFLPDENIASVNAFFDNIRDLVDYNFAFIMLKRDIAGFFGKISLSDVGLFGSTKLALIKIEKAITKFMQEYGFEEAIDDRKYDKMKKHCPDFGDEFDSFVEEERADFLKFLNAVKTI